MSDRILLNNLRIMHEAMSRNLSPPGPTWYGLAADEIERLTAEVEALRAENQRMRNRQDGMP